MKQSKNKATSMCGLDCDVCPAYIATVSNNHRLREKTAFLFFINASLKVRRSVKWLEKRVNKY